MAAGAATGALWKCTGESALFDCPSPTLDVARYRQMPRDHSQRLIESPRPPLARSILGRPLILFLSWREADGRGVGTDDGRSSGVDYAENPVPLASERGRAFRLASAGLSIVTLERRAVITPLLPVPTRPSSREPSEFGAGKRRQPKTEFLEGARWLLSW